MNTTTIVGIIIGIIVIAGGIWYVSTRHNAPAPAPTQQTEQATTPTNGTGTIAALWGMTGSLMCDVSSTDSANPFTGKVYIAGGKMRVDATAHIAQLNKDVQTHMVRADGFFYTWSDMMPQGIKIPETTVAASSTTSTSGNQGVSGTTNVSYTCAPWVEDASLLSPPANVTFIMAPTAH